MRRNNNAYRNDTYRVDRVLARLRQRQLDLAIAGRYVESGRYADRAAKLAKRFQTRQACEAAPVA